MKENHCEKKTRKKSTKERYLNNNINIQVGFLNFFLLFLIKFYVLPDFIQKKVTIESGEFLNYVKFPSIIVMCGEKYTIIKLF